MYYRRLLRAAGVVLVLLRGAVLRNAAVVVVFTLHRSFYRRTSAVPPVSFLILHPREIQILWVRQKRTKR